MNYYYILAIILGAAATWAAMRGATVSSNESSKSTTTEIKQHVEQRFNQIQRMIDSASELPPGPERDQAISEANAEHAQWATELANNLDIEVAQERVDRAESVKREVEISDQLRPTLLSFADNAIAAVQQLNQSTEGTTRFTSYELPGNFFNRPEQMIFARVTFSNTNVWVFMVTALEDDPVIVITKLRENDIALGRTELETDRFLNGLGMILNKQLEVLHFFGGGPPYYRSLKTIQLTNRLDKGPEPLDTFLDDVFRTLVRQELVRQQLD